MNEKQVSEIERAFSISLPVGYRQLLLNPPGYLSAVIEFDEQENPGQTPMFLDPDLIIGVNEMMRDPEDPEYFPFDPNDDSKPWPDRYFIIGSDVGGNFYCISPGSENSRVYFWYQGDTAFSRFADDMPHFVNRVFKLYGEIAAMDCEGDEKV